jgi:glycosyltransferase involved in cell wall biosynthesis
VRIALVSQEYPPETAKGGIGSQTYLKAHGLAARGHEVHVISHTSGPAVDESRDGNVRVIRTPGFYHRMAIWTQAVEWLTYSAEVAAVLAALHARHPLDLIDFPEWGAEAYIHLLNRGERYRIPTAIHLHGPLVMLAHTLGWPEIGSEFYRIGTAMEKTCLRLADAIFSSSQCSIDWCRKYYALPSDEAPVIHAGVDATLFAPRDVPKESSPTIVFVGRIAATKGAETLVDACCRLTDEFPDLQLRMFGKAEPGFIKRLKEKAAEKGLPSLLKIFGFASRDELPDHLCRAHVFAAPSIYEGGPGFVYLEAMACGLPVIGCSGSGIAEVIRSGENGVLVAPEDANALARALAELLRDGTMREAMGRRAREDVLKNAERELCLDRLEAFYRSVKLKTA